MRPSLAAALTLTALLATACGGGSEPAPAPAATADPEGAEPEIDEALFDETVVYVVADGLAYRAPDGKAEASMRVAAGDRFRILEETPGWYRLVTEWAEIPAWVSESAVRTAVEPAPVSVVNERLAAER